MMGSKMTFQLKFILAFTGYAEKSCTENGTWYYSAKVGEWTNFTTCSKLRAHLTQEHVHVFLYGLSVVALAPAIVIFFAYK